MADASAILDGLIARGVPPHVAAGILPNLVDESGLDPGINERNPTVPGSRGGFGLAQWTGPRRVALEDFAASQGRPVADIDTQLDFLVDELRGPESGAMQKLVATSSPDEAAVVFATDFLRPAKANLDRRVAAYSGGTWGDGSWSPGSNPLQAGGPDYAARVNALAASLGGGQQEAPPPPWQGFLDPNAGKSQRRYG